jgi:hypothetical protein
LDAKENAEATHASVASQFKDQSRVLRAYDNRLIYTNRRQDVYLQFFKEDATEVVVEYRDEIIASEEPQETHGPLPFGSFTEGSDDTDWIWRFRGCLSVLSVPFHVGRHWARSLPEVIRVVERLRDLHQAGFVHGDIRCSNAIFGNEASHLIDFDFGGKVGGPNPPRVPENYQFALADGRRKRHRRNARISWMDDVFAMTELVFSFHEVEAPELNFEATESVPGNQVMVGSETSELEALRKRAKLQDKQLELWIKQEADLDEKNELIAFANRDDVS